METVLARADATLVAQAPYPHIVLRDAIDPDLCARLIESYPPLATVAQSTRWASNQRFSYPAAAALRDASLPVLWREFVEVHTSQAFLDQLIALFRDSILAEYPEFEERFGRLDQLRAGIRNVDGHDAADVLLDGQVCVNTPVVTRPSSVRTGHLDRFDKLFAGLFYLRHPDDDSEGGDLELYRFRPGRYVFHGKYIDHRYLEVADTVAYEKNTLVVFLNTRRSLHGVSVRSRTETPRLFFNLVAEVSGPLFDLDDCQEGIARRAARRSAKILHALAR